MIIPVVRKSMKQLSSNSIGHCHIGDFTARTFYICRIEFITYTYVYATVVNDTLALDLAAGMW